MYKKWSTKPELELKKIIKGENKIIYFLSLCFYERKNKNEITVIHSKHRILRFFKKI